MKLQIELTEEQLQLIINALEVNFRMMQPRCGFIVADLMMQCPKKNNYKTEEGWTRVFEHYLASRENASNILDALYKIMYGDFWQNRDSVDYLRLSDMWSALRHLQYVMHPTDSWDVRSREPIQLSDYPMIKVEVIK